MADTIARAGLTYRDAVDLLMQGRHEEARAVLEGIEGDDSGPERTLALAKARDPKILPLLRAALWDEPLHRSILAGALIIDVAGVDALRDELQHPSLDASLRDLRRVGFALGEFGGLEQVEILGERLGSVDPALQGALLGALAARTY